jgi:hypothetical protein
MTITRQAAARQRSRRTAMPMVTWARIEPTHRAKDHIRELDEPTPDQPALGIHRLVAMLAAAFSPSLNTAHRHELRKSAI